MSRAANDRRSYLRYLRESRGVGAVVGEVALRLLRPIYHHQRQAIFFNDLQHDAGMGGGAEERDGARVECLTLLSPDLLDSYRDEVSDDVWPGLKRRFKDGRIAFLARAIEKGEDRGTIVGYSLWEPGVFSAMGRHGSVAPDILFGHYIYVHPAYRGRRIFRRLRATTFAYCRAHGFRMTCSLTSTRNRAALRARVSMGDREVGIVSRIAVLGGLLTWETPWEEIVTLLDA